MPSFSFREKFRRSSRSLQSSTEDIKTTNGNNGSSHGRATESNGQLPSARSSSTLNSIFTTNNSQGTPPPVQSSNSSTVAAETTNGAANGTNGTSSPSTSPQMPMRPQLHSQSTSKRSSVAGMSGLGSPVEGLPVSQYAPTVTSIYSGSLVHSKYLLIQGTVGDHATQKVDGNISISHTDDSIPPTQWPVSEGYFKALVSLNAGKNFLRLSFYSPRLANITSNNIHASNLNITYVPQTNTPPLHLVILIGKDSPGTYDSAPARTEREGNGIELAIAKYRMAGYLWQSYTQEQMFRSNFGRRTFRFEEEWTPGTANLRDRRDDTMRSEARVHVIRSEKTVAEIRDMEVAQQNAKASRSGDLFSWASADIKKHFNIKPGQKQYAAVLILDAHWDKASNTILGHAALGGGDGELGLAIFGSHALHSYPSCVEEVVPAFTDCTRTDTNCVANDCNESGSNWEAANIGIGAHLHEVGHLFGCPHQESGIMLRDYVSLNRSFITREAYSTRTGNKGGLVLQNDECNWHKLDCLRFRIHPCFKLPNDPVVHRDASVNVWPVENGVFLWAPSGVAYAEIFVEGDEGCKAWIEFGDGNGRGNIQKQYFLTEQEIRDRLPEPLRKKNVRLSVKSFGNGNADASEISASKGSTVKIGGGGVLSGMSNKLGYKGNKFGLSQMEGSEKSEIIFDSLLQHHKVMTSVVVYHGAFLDGIEFEYEDATSQLIGKKNGTGSRFHLDIRRGEIISGFNIRSGFWIDAIQIITSNGRTSDMYGATGGGSSSAIYPPRGYNIAGVSGTAGQWMDGFQAIIAR